MSSDKILTEFYDVKNKKKITIPMDRIRKMRFKRQTISGKERISYALRGEWNGRNFTRFINKQLWESLDVLSEKDSMSREKRSIGKKKARNVVNKRTSTKLSRPAIRSADGH